MSQYGKYSWWPDRQHKRRFVTACSSQVSRDLAVIDAGGSEPRLRRLVLVYAIPTFCDPGQGYGKLAMNWDLPEDSLGGGVLRSGQPTIGT